MRKTLCILFTLSFASACQKPLVLPLVQKYQVTPGDLFYFRDGQFVLLERRKALDIAAMPYGQAYAYPDKITVSRPMERKPGEFWGSAPAGEMWENKELTRPPVPMQRLAWSPTGGMLAGGAENG